MIESLLVVVVSASVGEGQRLTRLKVLALALTFLTLDCRRVGH